MVALPPIIESLEGPNGGNLHSCRHHSWRPSQLNYLDSEAPLRVPVVSRVFATPSCGGRPCPRLEPGAIRLATLPAGHSWAESCPAASVSFVSFFARFWDWWWAPPPAFCVAGG